MFKPIHKHVVYKIQVINPKLHTHVAKVFLLSIVEDLGMTAVTEPQVVHISDTGNEGLTGSINLSTSHVAFHIWDRTNTMMLDVYSCKEFDPHIPLTVVSDYFGMDKVFYSLEIDRDTGLIKEESK